MVALILADGDVPARSDLDLAWPAWDSDVELVIAADGGARHAIGLGVAIDLWVGDGDSIGEDALAALEAAILDARSRTVLVRAPGPDGAAVERLLPGRPGDLVSLLPLGPGVEGVTTRGLAYPLVDEALPEGPARGLSNVRAAPDAAIVVRRGLLLVVESPARLQP